MQSILMIGLSLISFGAGALVMRRALTGRFFGPVPEDKPAAETSPPASPK